MAEQRYQAVLAVIADGLSVKQVAEKVGVSRQTLHSWLARYEAQGLDGLSDRSRRPRSCPHQMSAGVEAVVLELRRVHRYWGARRIRHELMRSGLVSVALVPSESAVYRCLVRAGLVEPWARRRRAERFKRWERAAPMQRWQLDVVGGFLLADGTHAKALTGIDDHSRFCVSARLMPAERTRFHRTLRLEFDTRRVFTSLRAAQAGLDEWVAEYNTARPHQSLDGATPAEKFQHRDAEPGAGQRGEVELGALRRDRTGAAWVSRRVAVNGVISVAWQQICVGAHHSGESVDVHVTDQLLQIWSGSELIKNVARTTPGKEVRKKHASIRRTT